MRHELGLTLEEAADQAGLKRPTWRTWELGAKPRDMARVVRRIAETFGYDEMWLMWGGPLGAGQPDDDPGKHPQPATEGRPEGGSTSGYGVTTITGRHRRRGVPRQRPAHVRKVA